MSRYGNVSGGTASCRNAVSGDRDILELRNGRD
jgi:hypothetical protein